MAKNIVLCSDGTGATAIKGRGTNVFKLYEAVDLNGHRHDPRLMPQIAVYDDGIGSGDLRPVRIFAGLTGWGLARNVRHLYKSLVRVYDPGDNILLFGFSRGAFTVRALAGLIQRCGILDVTAYPTSEALDDAVHEAYRVHRQDYKTALGRILRRRPDRSRIEKFRTTYRRFEGVRIRFIGVWDTVDAVGVPWHIGDYINLTIHRFKFPDARLGAEVDHACQALAIDDERQTLFPLLWKHDSRIEQVWFPGCHSNVGGGYEKHGLSLISLDWMMRQAEVKGGLRFVESDRLSYRQHANADDKLYDPRAGTGILYRWAPRDMMAMCAKSGVPPLVHLSAIERIAHGTEDYSPGNLAPQPCITITETDDADEVAALLHRAKAVERVLHDVYSSNEPLLTGVRSWIALGRAAYYVYLVPGTLSLLMACTPRDRSPLDPMAVLAGVGNVLGSLTLLRFAPLWNAIVRLFTTPGILSLFVGCHLASWAIARLTGRRMSRAFSIFWHTQQPKLREALKR